jgi:Asp-tRNA(Asn)/Glu-tRNA(Gln) amidotransferase A subunit family amidase
MSTNKKSIRELRTALSTDANANSEIMTLAQQARARTSTNPSHNTYLWRDEAWTMAEAQRISAMPRHEARDFADGRPALWGIPISVKDCFDLAGSPTSSGTKFYRDLHGIATHDSWLVEHLRASGAVITGKTHLHPLAYGITGENAEFGDCLQPGNPLALTGGSSSGAAASVLESSAMAAIGTDTGGSVRVPAALCGIAGYRASISRDGSRGNWRGGAHLAESFDTLGWLFRDLEDGPLLGSIFGPTDATGLDLPTKFAIVHDDFLHDCEPEVITSLHQCQAELEAFGLTAAKVDVAWWSDSREIFAPIQASEAARIHRGHYAEFEASIQQRLEWGASLSEAAVAELRRRHEEFRDRMDTLLQQHELLLFPAAPVARLEAGADHSQTRTKLLRYTTPVSLAGMPAVTIPFLQGGRPTGGMQLVAAREDDARLLAIAAAIGAARISRMTSFRRDSV